MLTETDGGTGVQTSTTSLPPAGPARVGDQGLVDPHQAVAAAERGKDVTEWYRERYRGVVAAERLGAEVLVLFNEGESYGVSHMILAFAGTGREVLVRCWADRVPRSRIDPSRPLFGQWATCRPGAFRLGGACPRVLPPNSRGAASASSSSRNC
jgi:hypothetical protein